jgi:hypothetical protein
MKHFDDAAWSDFVKDVLPSPERASMQAHVDTGCKRCNAALDLWRNVLQLANQEKSFAPPEDSTHVTKSYFAALATLDNFQVRLVFDSLLQPGNTGIRGALSARQLLFETDDLSIDLRLDPRVASVSLIGQILERTHAKQPVPGLPIHLQEGRMQLNSTNTNPFGEFHFEFEPANGLYISILRREKPPIVLPLYKTHSTRPNNSGSA